MRRLIAGLSILALLLVAAGLTLASVFHGPPDDVLVDVVPEDAALYAGVYLDPSTKQGRSLQAFIARLQVDDASGLLDQLLEPCGATFDEVEDSGATQVGVFVLPSGAGACVTDGDPLEVEGRSAEVRDRWVGGAPEAVAAAVATRPATSLRRAPAFGSHIERVPFDRIALFFKSGEPPSGEADVALAGRIHRYFLPVGLTALGSTDGRLVFTGSTDAAGELWTEDDSVELSRAPRDAWLAAALPPVEAWVAAATRLIGDLGLDASAIAEPLNRALEVFPEDASDVAIAWAVGAPSRPSFGVRLPERTLTLFGPTPAPDGLASRADAREALEWLDGHRPIAFYGGGDGTGWLSLVASFAGLDLSLDRIDRAVLGVKPSGETLGWQLVVGASDPKG